MKRGDEGEGRERQRELGCLKEEVESWGGFESSMGHGCERRGGG